ncbi:hypothetical protein GQ53DRAFT_762769 [Thozetella sp. PMI_491]|nr:hypothetical protein GQ53DRAFT_762769 [Thozetella sp. PMI_491]
MVADSPTHTTPATSPAAQSQNMGLSSSPVKAEEDWRKISDALERRRIQNRIAQRAYRHILEDAICYSCPSVYAVSNRFRTIISLEITSVLVRPELMLEILQPRQRASEVEKWEAIFETLFPDTPVPRPFISANLSLPPPIAGIHSVSSPTDAGLTHAAENTVSSTFAVLDGIAFPSSANAALDDHGKARLILGALELIGRCIGLAPEIVADDATFEDLGVDPLLFDEVAEYFRDKLKVDPSTDLPIPLRKMTYPEIRSHLATFLGANDLRSTGWPRLNPDVSMPSPYPAGPAGQDQENQSIPTHASHDDNRRFSQLDDDLLGWSSTRIDECFGGFAVRVPPATLYSISGYRSVPLQPSLAEESSIPAATGATYKLGHRYESPSNEPQEDRRILQPPSPQNRNHESDSGPGTSIITSKEKTTARSSAITRSGSARSVIDNLAPLSVRATNRIYEHVLKPLLSKPAFKNFYPLIFKCLRKIQEMEIVCLRDVEKALLLLAPCIQMTIDFLSDHEQTRPGDIPYTKEYFFDLVHQIRHYAQLIFNAKEGEKIQEIDINHIRAFPGNDDFEYDGYMSTDSGYNDQVAPISWRVEQVKLANLATNIQRSQYWRWLYFVPLEATRSTEKPPLPGEIPHDGSWGVYMEAFDLHLRLTDVVLVEYSPDSLRIIIATKLAETLRNRGNILAQFRREHTKGRFLGFVKGHGVKLIRVPPHIVEMAWEATSSSTVPPYNPEKRSLRDNTLKPSTSAFTPQVEKEIDRIAVGFSVVEDDINVTDSGYASFPGAKYNTSDEVATCVIQPEIKALASGIIDEQDSGTCYSLATTETCQVTRTYVSELCQDIHKKLDQFTGTNIWPRLERSLPNLVKAFAIKIGQENNQAHRDIILPESDEVFEGVIDEEEDATTPDTDLPYSNVLLGSVAYKWLIANLQKECALRWSKEVRTIDTIRRTILDHLPSDRISKRHGPEPHLAVFRLFWKDIETRLNAELDCSTNPGQTTRMVSDIITVTCDSNQAQAATAREYFEQTWPSAGAGILSSIQGLMKASSNSGLLPDGTYIASVLEQPYAFFIVTAQPPSILFRDQMSSLVGSNG